ncbi:beta-1,3-galactosyltransferase 5-like [Tachypleus tridentatus]|uniref:beta-1,3-galactosyltransferase 5-like n=1 Tax=Tachypleus tridentatus TaxID=6853 RepID=UPI003FCF3158
MVGVSPHTDVQHHLAEENVRYGDIVQEDFPDTFKHLALKSVMGLKWSVSFCNNADFVMKTDEDIFVHVPNLLNILHNFYSTKERTLICHFNRVRRILRKDFLDTVPPHYIKYMVTDKELPGQYFPPYCAGLGYVFPISVGEDLYKAALSTPVFFIEDVYITGFCRYKARVEMYDHPSFTLKPSIHPQQGSCAFSDGRVTSQELEPQELQELWKQVNTQGFFCPQVVGYLS